MRRLIGVLIIIVMALGISACCGTEQNRKSKEAMLQTANVLEAESTYVQTILDPVKLATNAIGDFDKAACIEHSKMLELFKQDNVALAAALRAWAEDKDVEEYKPVEVDHEKRCTK